nr:hypothetical protein GCM10025699_03420 [Microbacterium flavescens]
MVESIARVRHIRVTPQKARRVVALIKGKQAEEALAILKFAPQSASEPIYKLVASAIANARVKADKDGEYLDEQDLYVANAYVDEGTTLKRFQPRAQGRAFQIKKRTSHITVVLSTPEVAEAAPAPRRRRRASNGPEGQPVRLPPRHHHGPRVALVLGLDEARTALRRLRGRGHQDPSPAHDVARPRRRQQHRDRAHA